MINKIILSLFAMLFVNVASAEGDPEVKPIWPSQSATVECTPATEVYPFNKFTVVLNEKSSSLKVEFSEGAGSIEASQFSTTEDDLQVEAIEAYELNTGELVGIDTKLYVDFYDWGAAKIEIGSDDDGHAAFVHFYSDGPSIRSFYRCALK